MADHKDRRDNKDRDNKPAPAEAKPAEAPPKPTASTLTAGALIAFTVLALLPQHLIWKKFVEPCIELGKASASGSWKWLRNEVMSRRPKLLAAWDGLKRTVLVVLLGSITLGLLGTYIYHDKDAAIGRWFVVAGGLLAVTSALALRTLATQVAMLILGAAGAAVETASSVGRLAKHLAGKLGVPVDTLDDDAGLKQHLDLMSKKISEMLNVIAGGFAAGFTLWALFPHWLTLLMGGLILLVAEMRFAIGAVRTTDHEGRELQIKRTLRGWQFLYNAAGWLMFFLLALLIMYTASPKTGWVISKVDTWLADPYLPSVNQSLVIVLLLLGSCITLYAIAAFKKSDGFAKLARIAPKFALVAFLYLLWSGHVREEDVAGPRGALPKAVSGPLNKHLRQHPTAAPTAPSSAETRHVDQTSPNRIQPASDDAFAVPPPSTADLPGPTKPRTSAPTSTPKPKPQRKTVIEQPDKAYDDLDALLADAEKVE